MDDKINNPPLCATATMTTRTTGTSRVSRVGSACTSNAQTGTVPVRAGKRGRMVDDYRAQAEALLPKLMTAGFGPSDKGITVLTSALSTAAEQAASREREACALVAKAHKGAATQRRQRLGQKLSKFDPEVQVEINAEERGEDIAADEIADTIRRRSERAPEGGR